MTFKLANNTTEISEKKSSTEEKENQRNKPAVHVKAESEQRSVTLPKELDKIDISQISADNKCKSNTHPLFVVDFNLEINNR